jgi:mannitol/fructose-specific phosphotransferase system IIA component (Ntr-type)
MKIIKVKCSGAALINIDLIDEFQGNLKNLSEEAYEKLFLVLTLRGIKEPISVWKNPVDNRFKILNGHQRFRVIKKALEKGYTLLNNEVPVSIVSADSEQEAGEDVLTLTSQYGEITEDGLYEYLISKNIPTAWIEQNLRLPEIDLDHFKKNFFDGLDVLDVDFQTTEKTDETKFIVAAYCVNEEEQKQLFEELSSRGIETKLMS